MIQATGLKNGVAFLFEGNPYKVLKYEHIKMGRGGAVVKLTAENLVTGAQVEKSFSSNVSLDEVAVRKRELQYLYKDSSQAVFMDPRTFEQLEIPRGVLKESILYLKEGETAMILFWEDDALSVEIPPKIVLRVTETGPGVKGNSATNIYKPAVLENGLKIKVPLFVKVGDKIKLDTRTGEYVERAK